MDWKSALFGSKGKYEQVSRLTPGQQPLLDQLTRASQNKGAGGAYGDAADYYRSLLDDDNSTFQAMAAPEMRRFNEDIVPDLAEQFAGMGSGGLSSSGFRNAGIRAGTDLSERLGAMRANLRQQGAAGLAGIGQQALGQYQDTTYRPGSEGILSQAVPLAASAFFGPLAGGAAGLATNWISSKGQSNPYAKSPGLSSGGSAPQNDFNYGRPS